MQEKNVKVFGNDFHCCRASVCSGLLPNLRVVAFDSFVPRLQNPLSALVDSGKSRNSRKHRVQIRQQLDNSESTLKFRTGLCIIVVSSLQGARTRKRGTYRSRIMS